MSCQSSGHRERETTDASLPSCTDGVLKVRCSGSSWSPVMNNCVGALICTATLADELSSSGLRLGGCSPVAILDADDGIRRKASPEYVYIRSRRGLEMDALPVKRKSADLPERLIPRLETWNGDDLFGAAGVLWNSLYVSRRFVLTAWEKGWDCFVFNALDLPQSRHYDALIRASKGTWPPVWYPGGTEPHPDNTGPMPEVPQDQPALEKSVKIPEGCRAWEPPVIDDAEAGEPTGFTLLGESVRWGFSSMGLEPDMASAVDEVKRFILQCLETALKAAEAYIITEAQESAGNEEDAEREELEVYGARIEISGQTPDDGSAFLWEIHIEVSGAGPCPSHFLVFQDSDLVDATAAD
ncbi:MAG: hypothetical protein JWM59_3508 [Verrucomicrobiales bacterium]|nr:hypothetical protein [Verrucomicrobiales bacterium]